jgi:membrane-bound ClpP family serine protease
VKCAGQLGGQETLIVPGICLLIIAAIVPKLAVLWAVGIIVLVVGVILLILGRMGHAVGGRRHYY